MLVVRHHHPFPPGCIDGFQATDAAANIVGKFNQTYLICLEIKAPERRKIIELLAKVHSIQTVWYITQNESA